MTTKVDSTLQGGRKVHYLLNPLSKQELFGNPFYESKLRLISVVTLNTEVAFGKKEPFSKTHDLWRMPITITTNFRNVP